ncbi:hypothetical protein JTB14_020467 [Gonioctena quinquepunctata]|nr:hypothetical protein JTB14_020467 [Gonioctena quinquepunctata]
MSAWRVVTFLEEDTVEAVPISWIRSPNQCLWPPFSGQKLKTAISKCMSPASDWDVHEARTIGEVYGDLSVARIKAVEAENNSDLNSESDLIGLGHRKIRLDKKYLESDSDQDDRDDTPSPEVSEIVMPVLKKGEKKKPVKI